MHYFSVAFLQEAADYLQTQGSYHFARKKIPSVSGPCDVRQHPASWLCLA